MLWQVFRHTTVKKREYFRSFFWSSEQNTLEQAEREICNESWHTLKNPTAAPLLPAWMCDLFLHCDGTASPHTSVHLLLYSSSRQQHVAGQTPALWANTFSHHTDANAVCVVRVTGERERESAKESKGGRECVWAKWVPCLNKDLTDRNFGGLILKPTFLRQCCSKLILNNGFQYFNLTV